MELVAFPLARSPLQREVWRLDLARWRPLFIEFGTVGIFGDQVVVGAYGVEPEAVVG